MTQDRLLDTIATLSIIAMAFGAVVLVSAAAEGCG